MAQTNKDALIVRCADIVRSYLIEYRLFQDKLKTIFLIKNNYLMNYSVKRLVFTFQNVHNL